MLHAYPWIRPTMSSVQQNSGGRATFMEGALMLNTTIFVGLDVHARKIVAAAHVAGQANRRGRP